VSPAEAERYLLGLELFGMRFGLDRMRRLMTVLGSPQEQFGSIHVVGTNGKSSTTRMIAAILRSHGLRTGTYLSPHLVSFTERVRVDDADVTPERFAAAVERARRAAVKVDRTLDPGDRVTQFEALTAAAYSELAAAGVEVAVIEAGLGGRYDATNVIPSSVQVLTNIGLEHTRWLGPTIADIAGEKLDVVREGSTLVAACGKPQAQPAHTAERAASPCTAPTVGDLGAYKLASAGSEAPQTYAPRAPRGGHLGADDEDAVRAAAASTLVPGRFQIPDGADGQVILTARITRRIAALAEALRGYLTGAGSWPASRS
jgi:dihydrofolate synthase/folylpolyglutamate synthase